MLKARPTLRLLQGHVLDVLRLLPERSVHCVVTSPPYLWLRDYGIEPQVWGGDPLCEHVWGGAGTVGGGRHGGRSLLDHGKAHQEQRQSVSVASTGAFCSLCGAWRGSLGLEPAVELYVEHLVEVFREVWRVLRNDGTLWLNLGDCYAPSSTSNHGRGKARPANNNGCGESQKPNDWENPPRIKAPGLKPKDLIGVPWRVALALQANGWYLRRDIVWAKANPMPESVTDRPSTAHEYVFLLAKRPKYFYDADAVREPLSEAVQARPYKQVFNSAREDVGLPGGSLPRRGSVTKKGFLEGTHGTTGEDGNGMRMQDKWSNPAGRNLRSVWSLASSPFPDAHFATFPVEIPTTAIKAGTSERGCCPSCGAPWARVVATTGETTQERARVNGHASHAAAYGASKQNLDFKGSHWKLPPRERSTTGWRPTCACAGAEGFAFGAIIRALWSTLTGIGCALQLAPGDVSDAPLLEPIPCAVLDPFNGAGTSGLAAARLGRSYIGIDLNEDYCGMARRRIEGDAPLLNAVEPEEDPQVPLFEVL